MKKQIILAILDALDEKGELKTEKELGIELQLYLEILQTMQNGNLLRGVDVNRQGVSMSSNIKITLEGIEYLCDYNHNVIKELNHIAIS